MTNVGAKLSGHVRNNSLAIGLTIIVVAMGSILFFQTVALNKLQVQADQNNKIINQIQGLEATQVKNATIRTNQIAELNRHMDCIVTFFSQEDRSQTAITDIDSCTLQDTKTGTTTTPPATSSTKTTTTTPNVVNPTKSATTSTNSSGSGGGATTGTTTTGSTSTTPTNPLGGTTQPSFLDKTVVTPLNNNVVQPIKNLLNDIL